MTPQIALAKTFLDSFQNLPKKAQNSVRRTLDKFQENPTATGLNFEHLNAVKDDKVRSLRIDQAYRAIVIQPPKGDVYLCVWVDKHDDAYEWVRNRRFEVNPTSGVFQLYDVDAAEAVVENAQPAPVAEAYEVPGIFDGHGDEDLLLAGVPQILMDTVRSLKYEPQLDDLAPHLPEDAAEMLYLLAAGYDLMEAIEEADRAHKAKDDVDVEDFSASLARPESQRLFKIVDGESELEAILDAPLEKWRVFLHPTQRKLVRMNAKGPVRVLGGAGTGKTVVLMHRANHLLKKVFTKPTEQILVTTFTRNLALDLRANLKNLCGDDDNRLDVTNLHDWAKRFMKNQGYEFNPVNDRYKKQLMISAVADSESLGHEVAFYLEEWDQIVQGQDVTCRDEYFTARRVGRGTPLTRKQRAKAWAVLARYRELLNEQGLTEWPDLVRETRLFIEKQGVALPYSAVLADEVQDFNAGDLKLLRALAPRDENTLYLVGDGHQRIYGNPVILGRCGIEIRGRSRRLKLNYRTTEQIGLRAIGILQGLDIDDMDGGLDTLKGYSSLRSGPAPRLEHLASEAEEAACIVKTIKQWIEEGRDPATICIAARTNSLIDDRYLPLLTSEGIEAVKVMRNPASEAKKPGVRLATMHRMKGLEFACVLLAAVQAGKIPLLVGEYGDYASEEDHQVRERCLLYVACTRARDELVVTGFGEPSPFLSTA